MSSFNRDKYNVILYILSKDDPLKEHFESRGLKVSFLDKGKSNPLTFLRFLNIIRRERINVMHVQGYASSTFGRLARVLTGIPVLMHYHDPHAECPWVQKISDHLLARYSDACIAVSNYVKKLLIENGKVNGLDPDKIEVLYNCIPIKEFNIPEEKRFFIKKEFLNIDVETKVIGCVANLFEFKGHRYLLEAIPRIMSVFPRTRFLIVGDGPLRPDLEALSRQLGIEKNIIFTGYYPHIPEMLSVFDVKVVPSLGEVAPLPVGEGAPIVVLEAMAMGRPIVATDVIEVLQDGVTGLIVRQKDPEAIAQSVINLLINTELAKRLGSNAKEESKKYDVHHYVRRLENIYDDLVCRSRANKTLRGAIFPRWNQDLRSQ